MERLFEANNNDAGKAYFRSSTDIVSVIATLIKLVKETRRNGLFFYYNELKNDLLRYEASLSSSNKPWIKAEAFCLYNKLEYNRLVIKQKKMISRNNMKENDC